MGNKLKEVTYLTIKNLKNNDIILPGEYSTHFANIARDMEVDITNEEVVLKDLHQDCERMDKIVKTTSNSLDSIHDSTKKAQTAIVNKDEASLASITNELSEMQKQIKFLQKELFSDALTGAYNRKWFADYYLDDGKFQNDGKMAFIDLNKFKIINDTHGHLLGDLVLKYLVKFLQKELAYEGVNVMRYAGDEFMVLFSASAVKRLKVEEKMNEAQIKLAKQKLKSTKVNDLQFSFSYGLVDFKTSDIVDDILEKADELMYENKQKNR